MTDTVLLCHCGFEARAADQDGLVAEVRRHAREAHGMALSTGEALLLASRAEPGEAMPQAVTQRRATDGDST